MIYCISYRDICTGQTGTPLPPDGLHVEQIVLVQVKVHSLSTGLALGLNLLVVDQARTIQVNPRIVLGVHHGRESPPVVPLTLHMVT